jgi:hypothetical protein
MKRIAVLAIATLLVLPLASNAQEKWVRGPITVVGGSAITVQAADGPMAFTVTDSTDIIAPGAGTATREAQKMGKAGATLDRIFKAGDIVEVHYTEAGGKMTATEIRSAGGAATAPAEPKKGSSARGTVTAISDASITVKGDAEWTFTIDQKTAVVGHGLGTAMREATAKGAPTPATTFIKVKDQVTVRFTGKHADEIHVTYAAK